MTNFESQMFASPGIRKNERNKQELGEDATGFIYTQDYAVLWIADGAPGRKVEFEESNFNSRILAKCTGECFEKVALKVGIPKMPSDEAFFREFTNELHIKLSELLKGMDECLRRKKDSLDLDKILEIKIDNKEKFYIFNWSTTFAGAIIDIKNKICHIMLMGDCVALVDNESNGKKFKTITGHVNRLFIHWSIKAILDLPKIELSNSHPRFETIESMDSIILMSDGVINYNDIKNKFENKDIETVWNELKLMNNKTGDDKTALFFKLLE